MDKVVGREWGFLRRPMGRSLGVSGEDRGEAVECYGEGLVVHGELMGELWSQQLSPSGCCSAGGVRRTHWAPSKGGSGHAVKADLSIPVHCYFQGNHPGEPASPHVTLVDFRQVPPWGTLTWSHAGKLLGSSAQLCHVDTCHPAQCFTSMTRERYTKD